jgi:hypothetical protein
MIESVDQSFQNLFGLVTEDRNHFTITVDVPPFDKIVNVENAGRGGAIGSTKCRLLCNSIFVPPSFANRR